jgi:hypothetical protein
MDHTNTMSWYVNFADTALFGYYGSNLMAQDEIQVNKNKNIRLK